MRRSETQRCPLWLLWARATAPAAVPAVAARLLLTACHSGPPQCGTRLAVRAPKSTSLSRCGGAMGRCLALAAAQLAASAAVLGRGALSCRRATHACTDAAVVEWSRRYSVNRVARNCSPAAARLSTAACVRAATSKINPLNSRYSVCSESGAAGGREGYVRYIDAVWRQGTALGKQPQHCKPSMWTHSGHSSRRLQATQQSGSQVVTPRQRGKNASQPLCSNKRLPC